jgi:deoxyribose-phosphate aldolase
VGEHAVRGEAWICWRTPEHGNKEVRERMEASGNGWTRETLAGTIDSTLLHPGATPEDIRRLCEEAMEYHFASVCVNPCYVAFAAEHLSGSDVAVCTVVGFPLGANLSDVKAQEALFALRDGARELDMVLNVGLLKAGDLSGVEEDIRAVTECARGEGALVKVIIEACLLDDGEKVAACGAVERAGALFVKTSTGFGKGGATVEDVRLLRRTAGNRMGVKASGGIRTLEDALLMLEAGASRLGTSSGAAIIEALPRRGHLSA